MLSWVPVQVNAQRLWLTNAYARLIIDCKCCLVFIYVCVISQTLHLQLCFALCFIFLFSFFLAKTALWQSWRWLIFSELFQTDWERITKKLKCFFSVQKGLCNKILFRAFGSCGKMKEIYETFTTGKLCWDPCSWNAFMGSNLRNSLLVRMPFNIPNSSVFLEYWLGVIKTQLSQKQYLPVNLYSLFHLRGSGIKI